MEVKMINNKRLNNLIKSKKRLLNSLFFWSALYLISGQIIHTGMNLSYKTSIPFIMMTIYINYLAFKIRLRDYNKEMFDLVLFSNGYSMCNINKKLI